MARGRLNPPNLDDRKWQDLVDQAKALIPIYAPEWTDHNPSDLGIALIELFAWLVEGLTYRLNRVPEKNFIEFLNLLGITRDPATPASTFLTYRAAPGTAPLLVPKGSQAATPQTETEAAIVFETDKNLTVLPTNLTTALYIFPVETARGTIWKYQNVTNKLIIPPLYGMNMANRYKISFICLGFDAASTEPIALNFQFSKPAPKSNFYVNGAYSTGNTGAWASFPILEPAPSADYPVVSDGTKGFQQNGILSITLPGTLSKSWTSQTPQSWVFPSPSPASNFPSPASNTDEVTQSLVWLFFIIQSSSSPVDLSLEHILFNSVPATNALTIAQPELLGSSTGEPFQFFELQNAPLYKRAMAEDPYDHLRIQVRFPKLGGGFDDWTEWVHRDDFPAATPSDSHQNHYFRLDPVTGTINFGNYKDASTPSGHGLIPHGLIPPLGSEIRALTYRYVVGGAKGNVAPDTITVIRTPLAGLVTVTNPGRATDGSDEEAIEDTKRRGPEVLRNRYRAVTVEDYEYLAKEATTDVKKVRCLPPRLYTTEQATEQETHYIGDPWTYGGLNRSVNNANVIIVPDAPLSNPRPMPSEELLQEVSDYLEERRVLTNLLHVTYPRYLPIKVIVDIKIWQKALVEGLVVSTDDYEAKVKAQIREFLHPILGGSEKQGWEVGQAITVSELLTLIQPDTNVGYVSDLKVQAETPLYTPTDRPFALEGASVMVRLADYELICSAVEHTVKATPENQS